MRIAGRAKLLNLRFSTVFALLLASCVAQQPRAGGALPPLAEDIIYVSTDLGRIAVFTKNSARFGSDLAVSDVAWPSSPAKYLDIDNNTKCVSIGPEFNTIEFAIKRPIRMEERYSCFKTKFRVAQCFSDCRAAVVEREYPLPGLNNRETMKSYFYVDSCLGVLAFSRDNGLEDAIPHNAEWLRGSVGILADKDYPSCSRF
jgi:hypothetical protein